MGLFESAKKLLKRWKKEEAAGESIVNFTPRAQQVLALARREVDRFNHNYLGTEHMLLGLIKLGQGVAVNVLQGIGIDLETVRMEVEKQTGKGPDQKLTGNAPYTPRVKKVLDFARREAKNLNHTYIGTEHLLLGLLREGDGIAAQILRNLNVDIEHLRIAILKELDPNYISDKDRETFRIESINKFFAKQPEAKQSQGSNFTPHAQKVLSLARKEADRLNHNYLGVEHILLGLIALGGGVATNVLIKFGLNLENVRAEVEKFGKGKPDEQLFGNIPYTARMKKVLDFARRDAKALNHTYIGTQHLLLGLLREKEGPAAEIFKTFKVDMEQTRTAILKELDPNFGESK